MDLSQHPCRVEGCVRERRVSGGTRRPYCGMHESRRRRHGDVFADIPAGELRSVVTVQLAKKVR